MLIIVIIIIIIMFIIYEENNHVLLYGFDTFLTVSKYFMKTFFIFYNIQNFSAEEILTVRVFFSRKTRLQRVKLFRILHTVSIFKRCGFFPGSIFNLKHFTMDFSIDFLKKKKKTNNT